MRTPLRLVRAISSSAVVLPSGEAGARSGRDDGDLLPVWIILWIGSVARVVAGLAGHEAFGVEATLALLCVAVIPWIVLGPWIRALWVAGDGNHDARADSARAR